MFAQQYTQLDEDWQHKQRWCHKQAYHRYALDWLSKLSRNAWQALFLGQSCVLYIRTPESRPHLGRGPGISRGPVYRRQHAHKATLTRIQRIFNQHKFVLCLSSTIADLCYIQVYNNTQELTNNVEAVKQHSQPHKQACLPYSSLETFFQLWQAMPDRLPGTSQ